MACYCDTQIRYRGRLLEISWRYCVIMDWRVLKGKPLIASDNDERKIDRLANRLRGTRCVIRENEEASP